MCHVIELPGHIYVVCRIQCVGMLDFYVVNCVATETRSGDSQHAAMNECMCVLQGALEYVRLTASTSALQTQCPHASIG